MAGRPDGSGAGFAATEAGARVCLKPDLRRRLDERKIDLELTEAARHLVARRGFDPVYGARPLKRYLQHELETRIGRAIIGGEVLEGAKLIVTTDDSELQLEIRPPDPLPEAEADPIGAVAGLAG